ncbi:MAG: AraC family transcriptional regulator [Desulfomonilaceae bacterium]|nr:AraC family transcriptional regulator [Desulfomonilaceae bacterium]
MTESRSRMSVTHSGAEDIGTQFRALFGPLGSDVNEISVASEGPLVNGTLGVHPVRPGMRLFTMDVNVRQDIELTVEPANPGILVSLVLDGRSDYTVQGPQRRHDRWEFTSGSIVIGTFQPEKSQWNVLGGGTHRLVELQIASGRARQLLSEYRKTSPGTVHPLLERSETLPQHVTAPLTPELGMIAHQVLTSRLEGIARRLFMESKALEILAYQFHAMTSHPLPTRAVRSRQDHERLEEARAILEKELADPPSLLALARRVGLNDFKLKRGFREIYQTTVYGYVRMLRMDKARTLLETGEMNVGEVAAAVGYSCFGHFSEAFRQRFGMYPRDLKKTRRF